MDVALKNAIARRGVGRWGPRQCGGGLVAPLVDVRDKHGGHQHCHQDQDQGGTSSRAPHPRTPVP